MSFMYPHSLLHCLRSRVSARRIYILNFQIKETCYSNEFLLLDAIDMLNGDVGGSLDDHHQDDGFDFDNFADYEQPEGDDDDDGDLLLQSNGKRARKEEIQWTEQKEYVLVCAYKSEKAYMRGKKEGDLKLEHKRLVAFNKVKDHASFKDDAQLLTAGGVHAKFTRLWKAMSTNKVCAQWRRSQLKWFARKGTSY